MTVRRAVPIEQAGFDDLIVDDASIRRWNGLRPEPADDSKLRAWMASTRAANADHPGHTPGCDGCEWWGVCAYHAPPAEPGQPARNAKQAEAWARIGYVVEAVMPEPEDVPQDLQENDEQDQAAAPR